jgi:hypothetical protein
MGDRRWYLLKLYVSAEPDELEALCDRATDATCPHVVGEHNCDRDWAITCFELAHVGNRDLEDEVAWQVVGMFFPTIDDGERDDDREPDPDLRRILDMIAMEMGLGGLSPP